MTMKNKIWLSTPHMGGAEQKYIQEAFDQNWVAPLGPNVDNLEEDLKFFLGKKVYVAALSSGTAAVHLALIMLGVEKDDEVICQTFTFTASANPIVYLGAKPIFVDSEKETWNICPINLELAIQSRIDAGKKPKVIILVHLYGMPAKLHEIITIAEKYNITLLEDAAEALGSTYNGQKCGTFGEIGVLSFNGNKIITTSGGGALVFKSVEQKRRAIFLATQAKDDAPHYQHTEIGYNYRMSNISAGIGRGQMEVLNDRILKRRENHQFYVDLFRDKPGVKVFSEPNKDYLSNHWLSIITIDEKIAGFSRENFRLYFEIENIETRPLWKPLHLQPVFKNVLYFGGNIAENLFRDGLCLPSGSNLSDEEKYRIKNVVETFFQNETFK
jgi:dTDP-4-amino-4,6-dideoxygalactose transaminase